MKKLSLLILMITVFSTLALGQKLTQTVRGTIIDVDSKLPLINATIVLVDSDPLVGTITDVNGNFRLENIPTGRISLQLSYMGYEDKITPNIIVNSGKEVVLNLSMQESAVKLDEVVVRPYKNKGEALNDMSIISSRSISVEETKRYAGGFDDPSRVVSNFAGISNTPDGSSDIIVRGNSSKYIQWGVEGIEISNPYHFNTSFGGLSILNNNLLTASDFYTGAFSAEYGNVLSGVFDVNLRAGNNEQFESAFGFGLLGTDLTLEGPFKKGYAGSYLVNYRYSTTSLIGEMGLIDVGGTPKYQDATFKVVLPTKNAGIFSVFGLGGLSSFLMEDIEPKLWITPGNQTLKAGFREDYDKVTYQINVGLNHTLSINDNSFVKTSLSYSTSGTDDEVFESKMIETYNEQGEFIEDVAINKKMNYDKDLVKSTLTGALAYSNKINAKNKIQAGVKYSLFNYDYQERFLRDDKSALSSIVDFKENVSTVRNYISWKYRVNKDVTIVSGLHNMNVLLNNKSTLEPRIAMSWKLNQTSSFHAGYGKHSTLESIHHYFAKVEQPDGSYTEPNKDLDLLKAHHFILGYEKRFSKNLMAKAEVYYQKLHDLPVENLDTSYYATINEDFDFRYVDLVNKGTGENYGIELTLERFFDNNYFFLVNGSFYNSTYKSLEGVNRNTRFNNNFLINFLYGKEIDQLGEKNNQTLTLNSKVFFRGGQTYIPLLRDAQGNLAVDTENNRYWAYDKAYDQRFKCMYQVNLSASYKFNRPKATHEIFIDLQNITNSKGKISEYYDESEPNSIGNRTQFGFFPNLMYRVYF